MVDFENDIKKCVETLEAGGTILYPTDTVWGLGCNALDEAAVDKIFNLKQRPKEKSLIILLAEARDILKYVAAPPPDIIETVENFERPTTVIYDGALGFPGNAVSEDGSIAIRVTKDPFCKALINRFRKPLGATSANISGQSTPVFFDAIDNHIIENVDYVVKYRQDDKTTSQPSRLLRILDDGSFHILRP